VQALHFETKDGLTLEGELRMPDGPARGAAVICHPHPLHGGSKDHPLLWAIRIELATRGFAVLAFNFRGVMGSEGAHSGGVDEVLDVRAAVERARLAASGPIFVCGWSFGAYVALRAAMNDERIVALALVGFPLSDPKFAASSLLDPDQLSRFRRPTLLLAGDDDPYCPVQDLLVMAGRLPRSTVEIVPGAGHYFSRREREAATIVGRFAVDAIGERSAQ
jgi:uncharacterized protein